MAKSRLSIVIDYNNAIRQANSLTRVANELGRCITRSENTEHNIDNSWNGENSRLFLDKTNRNIDDIRKLKKNINKISDAIKSIAKRTYDAEMRALQISQRRTYN